MSKGEGSRMALSIQLAALMIIAGYLVQVGVYMHRRGVQGGAQFEGGFAAEPMSGALHHRNFSGAWMRFRNARLLSEMIDYAELSRNAGSAPVEAPLLISLRRDAMQARITSLVDMAKCVWPR